jgi:hypothetical protein
MEETRSRRQEILERLNAYDSGPHEDDRRAAGASERCTNLLTEMNRWPSTAGRVRTIATLCGK